MTILQVTNLTYQHANGDNLFKDLSFSVDKPKVIGLVGKNGCGKSILVSILSGLLKPSSGQVSISSSINTFHQQSIKYTQKQSLIELVDKKAIWEAIKKIEKGVCCDKLFKIVGENWALEEKLNFELKLLGLPQNPMQSCSGLSDGELTRLKLWSLFQEHKEILFLDEPSNTLDTDSKKWLCNKIKEFRGTILLVSHDRYLLNHTEEIWELSSIGLKRYGGNYDFYKEQKINELESIDRQLNNLSKQKEVLKKKKQKSREATQKRENQGKQLRKSNSQPKKLLDFKINKALRKSSSHRKMEVNRMNGIHKREQCLVFQKEQLIQQKIYIKEENIKRKRVISLSQLVPMFGSRNSISMEVFSNDKIILCGNNGSGKTTLLKTIMGDVNYLQGELHVNTNFAYLNHNLSLIDEDLSVLDNVMKHCNGLCENDARTILAGIGLNKNKVHQNTFKLSGGEKMKLVMLIVSHQKKQNFLLLDEPDNHLDLDSKLLLSNLLNQYKGGYILVSHDEVFVKSLVHTKVVNFYK